MTLIAAFKIEGVPALIGDFLITDMQPGAKHVWIPTQPNLNDPDYPKLRRRISGLRRKLHLINDQFVVGFTGDVDAGAAILADLERRFSNAKRGPPITEISRAFERFNIQYYRRATVIGWTGGSNPRCFKWNARPGSSATHVTHAIEGSGSGHFAGLVTERSVSGGYSAEVKTAFEKAVLLGLTTVGAVLTEELRTGMNLRESYGPAAEIILFTGSRFRFVSKLGYTFWNARIELDGSVRIIPSNVIAAYEARDRYCALQVTHLDIGKSPIKATNAYLQAITPVHDDMPNLILTKADEVHPECDYYFNGIVVHDARTNITYVLKSAFIMSETSPFKLHKKDGLYHFQWDRKQLEEMIFSGAGR